MVALDNVFLRTLVDTIIYLPLFGIAAKSITQRKKNIFGWILVLLFCVYAFWAGDYYHFYYSFITPGILEEFRDPLYQYLVPFSLGSYSLFRIYIWGGAMVIFMLTLKRLNLNYNIALYVFISFFLLTFSYARASLGMALCFYAFSFLVVKDSSVLHRLIVVSILLILAFWAHRSMAIIAVIMLVSMKIKLNKKTFWLLLIFTPLFSIIISSIFSFFSTLEYDSQDQIASFIESAQGYSSSTSVHTWNWKYNLIRNIHEWSFYVAFAVIIQVFVKESKKLSPVFKKLATLATILLAVSLCIKLMEGSETTGLDVLNYRIRYMCGLPIVMLLTYLYQYNYISKNKFRLSLLLGQIYTWATFIGVLISNI